MCVGNRAPCYVQDSEGLGTSSPPPGSALAGSEGSRGAQASNKGLKTQREASVETRRPEGSQPCELDLQINKESSPAETTKTQTGRYSVITLTVAVMVTD